MEENVMTIQDIESDSLSEFEKVPETNNKLFEAAKAILKASLKTLEVDIQVANSLYDLGNSMLNVCEASLKMSDKELDDILNKIQNFELD